MIQDLDSLIQFLLVVEMIGIDKAINCAFGSFHGGFLG